MQQQQQQVAASKIDQSDYEDEDLISIKIQLNLPYYNYSPLYERAYGSMNIDGVEYDYVKRRVLNDTLELLCLPNQEKTKLQSLKNEFLKLSIETPSSQTDKKSSNIVKISLPDYSQQLASFSIAALHEDAITYCSKNFSFTYADHSSVKEQPPETI